MNGEKLTPEIILAKLEELGHSSREIANALYDMNCLGVPNDEDNCPLAVYLKSVFNAEHVTVYETGIVKVVRGNTVCITKEVFPQIVRFIKDVDAHRYPELCIK